MDDDALERFVRDCLRRVTADEIVFPWPCGEPTLLGEEWARFPKDHSFPVDLSIDAPRAIHDHFRVTKHGEPTFDQVFAAAQMLRRHGMRSNALTCVSRCNASRRLEVYRFLRRERGSTHLHFIPIVEPRESETIAPPKWDPARLPVLVNFCRTRVVQRMGLPSQVCVFAENCGRGVALEHDGSVYSCDHCGLLGRVPEEPAAAHA